MNVKMLPLLALGFLAGIGLVVLPMLVSGYVLALAISILNYSVLTMAWALFCGPTHYISLASAAFFGIGAYLAAIFGEVLPWPLVLLSATLVGLVIALVVGLSTLRLSGAYFVIFTFGLAELIRQLVSWFEVNVKGTMGRYLFLDISQSMIYWQLLALAVTTFALSWWIGRGRLGLAARVIGNDETVARHTGINTTQIKVLLFAISASIMALTGAIMAPRWTYIDPAIAFNPMISFQVVIMALLGGTATLFGPLLGAIPLVLLFEVLTSNFPNAFSILLGLVFILIVYGLPQGVSGLISRYMPGRKTGLAVHHTVTPIEPLLRVSDLGKSFGGLRAVDGVSFEVIEGQILGLVGPNGSGKTTVLNLISGHLRADSGVIAFNGTLVTPTRADQRASGGIARTFQLVRILPGMTVRDNIFPALAFRSAPLSGMAAHAQAERLLTRVGLGGKGDLLATELTYIDQKRLELARALALEPKLLLLDEWLAGLNPTELDAGIDLIHSLRSQGITIIMVEHVMDAIHALCDRCIVMNAGRIIAVGEPERTLAEPEVVRAYLGDVDA